MWESKSKHDLTIEVWEKLDCESIGRVEIEAIVTVITAEYGTTPNDTPMKIARLLADEGAELRHSEILEFDVEVRTNSSDLPLLSKPLDVSSVGAALKTVEDLEALRLSFTAVENKEGLRKLRKKVIDVRDDCTNLADNHNKSDAARSAAAEISEFLTIWIQSPEIYKAWKKAKYPKTDN